MLKSRPALKNKFYLGCWRAGQPWKINSTWDVEEQAGQPWKFLPGMFKKIKPALNNFTWDVEEQANPEIFPVKKLKQP
jgi:hypothetical protein